MEPPASSTTEQTCYRHKDRRAGVRCQRCERPICPQCMHTASVGFHCPECAKTGKQKVYTRANMDRAPGMRPIVTQVLMAINIAVFVVGIAIDRASDVARQVSANPFSDGSFELLTRGGLFGPAVAQGEWYRLVTAGFLHIGLVHLGLNMYVLYRMGTILEPALGRTKFIVCYFTSLLCGSLGVMLVEPNSLGAGASGAIFGLFGLLFLIARARGIDVWASGIAPTILLNVAITFGIKGISIGAHIGGLVGGLICGYLLFDLGPKQLRDPRVEVGAVAAIGVAAFVVSLLVA